ncbi:hypothetical protein HUO12_13405 [Altererythrobacter sp. JGD-16]|uniref:Restriction endonuclease n=2 Tax=Altererythrobacter lutimaris TaxID=2743979 RepID=A0A850HFB8_9SPHN|nr:hypothetical protein [Altererythrobacter lutimaris]
MPRIIPSTAALRDWGSVWLGTAGSLKNGEPTEKEPNRFDKKQGMDFGKVFDRAFGEALATMLGGIDVVSITSGQGLLPPQPNCVEVGDARIIGGVRPQNFDAAYRPDGPRVVLDSKTLNDEKSIGKNWQNMVNDLSTESTTIHTRFPYCVVVLIIAVPRPALLAKQEKDIIRTLERLGSRSDVLDQAHLAEAIALVVWDPHTGELDPNVPNDNSPIRLENVSKRIFDSYKQRYQGLPPHDD